MSVGGKVTETIILPSKVWINTLERVHQHPGSAVAIYVENTPESRAVAPGDTVWWQGGYALWTPKDKRGNPIERADGKCNVHNIKLKRIGFSGVKRPEQIQAL